MSEQYEIINDWPDMSNGKIGDIITFKWVYGVEGYYTADNDFVCKHPSFYQHLFRFINPEYPDYCKEHKCNLKVGTKCPECE